MPTVVTPLGSTQTSAAVQMSTAMTPPAPSGAAAASMANDRAAQTINVNVSQNATPAAVAMPTTMTPPTPSGAAAASVANESTDRAAQTINVNVSQNATPAAVVMPTTMTPPSPSGAAAASVANESTLPTAAAPSSAGAQKGHQQLDQKHLTFSCNHFRLFEIPPDFLHLRKKYMTEEFCAKRFDFAPYVTCCQGGQVIFSTDNVKPLPMNKETTHEYQQTLLAFHAGIQRLGRQFYEKKIVERFQNSGLVKCGVHSPQNFQEVLNVLRSGTVRAKAKQNFGWFVVFICENFWSVMDDTSTEEGLGDALRQYVGPKFTFEDSGKVNGQTVKHVLIRIANQARDTLIQMMHSLERSYGFMLHKKEGRHSTFESPGYGGFGPGRSYTIPLRLEDLSQNHRVVFLCKRSAVTVSKRILPPSMANKEPSSEEFTRWLQKTTLDTLITNLVQHAIINNVPEGHLTHLVLAIYAQMSGMIGCPISAHAPQRPKGNQLGAISNHNTGANKVSPICERTPALENGFDAIFDYVSLGDAKAQNGDSPPLQGLEDIMDDTSVLWEYPLNTDQTLTKVCFPRHFSCLILQAHLLAVHIFTHPVFVLIMANPFHSGNQASSIISFYRRASGNTWPRLVGNSGNTWKGE